MSIEEKKLKEVDRFIVRIKNRIQNALSKKNHSKTIGLMRALAKLLYFINQEYKDDDLEAALLQLVQSLFGNSTWQDSKEKVRQQDGANEGAVLFYNGFGSNMRGLSMIYLKALLQRYHVIYVVNKKVESYVPEVRNLLQQYDSEIVNLHGRSFRDDCYELKHIIEKKRPKHLFLYTTPWDIVGLAVFRYFGVEKLKRYQINLTDHAFWLGVNSFDYCIEFRDYGAYISHEFREIPMEKLRLLPYYPIIDYNREFEGFPFAFDSVRQKLVFSGGALYKTLGAGNVYYQIVRHMLDSHPEVVFWYAGEGDDSQLRLLMHDYPERVYHTKERKDLYQVLKHSYLYLNTYPMVGGLMFQYAAAAGKVPLTLKYDDCANDCLIGQSQLGVEFNSLDALFAEMDRLLSDPDYAAHKGEALETAIITEEEFAFELEKIMQGRRTKFPITLKPVDTTMFRRTYIERFSVDDIGELLVDRQNMKYLFFTFPKTITLGIMKKIGKKIRGR